MKKGLLIILLLIASLFLNAQKITVSGVITDSQNTPLPGATVQVKGTTTGVLTDANGRFTVDVSSSADILVISFVGYNSEEVIVGNQKTINVILSENILGLEEVIVVGYGTQKKSDVTGTVASLPKDRLEMVPNLNIAQAIQGAVPGVMIQTSSAGAASNEVILIRGRNSIKASNDPLIVVDGVPYGGQISDINTNDVQSIEVLKDASSAAIYGSRGANGVILITTKEGQEGKLSISYEGKYSVQDFINMPDIMDGREFHDFKLTRHPGILLTQTEQNVYDSGNWVNWMNMILQKGHSQQHNLSFSGGSKNTSYYIAGSYIDVQGLIVNDNYKRITNRINIDTKFNNWLSFGTRTQFSFDDQSGRSPSIQAGWQMSPLSIPYDNAGNLTIYPWPEDTYFQNPLAPTLYKDVDKSHQIVLNNYAAIDVPFIPGLNYRLNVGFRFRFLDKGYYAGRDTKEGLEARGRASTDRNQFNSTVIENVLSYSRTFGLHNIFATGVFSFEGNKTSSNSMSASGFPHDFLTWYSSSQAELIVPAYSYNENYLISQMLRFNYSYGSRYLVTLTSRRDGYSGFGTKHKWGIFPSFALGWNISNESFFPWKNIINELKLRASIGYNGNQAVSAYESISRLSQFNMVSNKTTVPGYRPSKLGQDELGWESSRSINLGLDFGIYKNRISGEINIYNTNTTDLLLDRSISAVHGITSITQNIGETRNIGLEVSLNSRNIIKNDFSWTTSGNLALLKNKIVSLYGTLDEKGKEIDDVANEWFIGYPIRVNFDYVWLGTWQLEEAEEAASWGSQPGFVKLWDADGDKTLTAADRRIIGQRDPKFLWGLNNSFTYKNFGLDIFVHGIHGVTKRNTLMADATFAETRQSTTKKDWWTPTNPTNKWVMNHYDATRMGGITAAYYEKADFLRLKDLSFSYNFSKNVLEKLKITNLRAFITGRNLLTLTKWSGLDPELDSQTSTPLQREFVIGLNTSF